jgi:hypothetical protein
MAELWLQGIRNFATLNTCFVGVVYRTASKSMPGKFEVSTIAYEQRYGHKPRGFGLWYFRLPGGLTFSYTGGYHAAARAASAFADRLQHGDEPLRLYA